MTTLSPSIRAGAALLALALTGLVGACDNSEPAPASSTNRAKVASADDNVAASIEIPKGPGAFAVGEGAVWAVSEDVSKLARIDPRRNAVVASIKLETGKPCPAFPKSCGEMAAGGGAVWISRSTDNTVLRVAPRSNTVTARIKVGPQPDGIAVSRGAVWVLNAGGPSVSRIDPATNRVVATIRIGTHVACCADHMNLAAADGAVWVGVPLKSAVVRIDSATNATKMIRLESQPCGYLVAAGRALWVSGAHCGASVIRVDTRANKAVRTVSGTKSPIGLAIAAGDVWVADLDSKAIARIDSHTARVVSRIRVGGQPIRLAAGMGSIWVRDDSGRVLRINP
jgi:DNA-binding beta-propeller fold protein YncE